MAAAATSNNAVISDQEADSDSEHSWTDGDVNAHTDNDVIVAASRGAISPAAARTQALILLLAVSVIWVGASQLVRSIYTGLHASLPWSLTYINVAEFALLLPLRWLWERCRGKSAHTDWQGAAQAAAYIAPVWYIAQGTYNVSLSGTTVSSSTMLSTTSCAFTLLLSLCMGERPAWRVLARRGAGVFLVITGAALVSRADTEAAAGAGDAADVRWGDALALFSAVAYACYTTMISKLVPDTDRADASGVGGEVQVRKQPVSLMVFFGYIGVFTSIIMGPFVLSINVLGLESMSRLWSPVPGSTPGQASIPILLILAKGLLDNVLSDLLWARAVRLTSATLGTVALSLTIPLALASDALFHGLVPSGMALAGGALVMGGFVTASLAEGQQ